MILDKDWNTENKVSEITEVLTTREIEEIYGLPVNKVLQDIRRGVARAEHVRQSGKVWLLTRTESNRLYSNYKPNVYRRNSKKQVS